MPHPPDHHHHQPSSSSSLLSLSTNFVWMPTFHWQNSYWMMIMILPYLRHHHNIPSVEWVEVCPPPMRNGRRRMVPPVAAAAAVVVASILPSSSVMHHSNVEYCYSNGLFYTYPHPHLLLCDYYYLCVVCYHYHNHHHFSPPCEP